MFDKRHCCCCVPIHEGVALVGIYGASFHTAMLIIQLSFGPTITPEPELLHPEAADVLEILVIIAHVLGMVVNFLLVIGVWRNIRHLIVPWLLVQGFLAALLVAMALYFLVIFPDKTSCTHDSQDETEDDKFFNPFYQMVESRTQAPFNPSSNGQCTILLWFSVVMVLSLLILTYYVYVVQEYFAQKRREATARRKAKFPPPIPIIELRERQALDENVFVQELDDADADFDDTRQTNVTEDFGDDSVVVGGGAAELQIKPLATSSSKRPAKDRPTVTFGQTEIM